MKIMDASFNSMSYNEIFEYVIDAYINEFGEKKFRDILGKVLASNKVSKLINVAKCKCVAPGSEDFLCCLLEIPYFMISRNETHAVAALIALQRWNEEANSYQLLVSDQGLKNRAIGILEKLKIVFF